MTDPAPHAGTPADERRPPPRPAPGRAAEPRRRRRRRRGRAALPAESGPALDIARRIVELAEDKKAADIILLDLTGLTTLADCVRDLLGRLGAPARRDRRRDDRGDAGREGPRRSAARGPPRRTGSWSTSASVVVHIFTPPEREYYSLEKHWSEAKTVLRVQ